METTVTSSNGSLYYRRKTSVPTTKTQQQQQSQSPTDLKRIESNPLEHERHRGKRRSGARPRRIQSKAQCPKPRSQPVVLKQLLWKAKPKTAQPTLRTFTRPLSTSNEDEAVRGAALALDTTKKTTERSSPSESCVAGSSSQETQSGSEDDVVFLRYRDLRPAVQPSTTWRMEKEDADLIDRVKCPVMPLSNDVGKHQVTHATTTAAAAAVTRRKPRQKYRLKQKHKRAAAAASNEHNLRFPHQPKQENKRLPVTQEDTELMRQDEEKVTESTLHSSMTRKSAMDADCVQLKEAAQFIVVGDVACPVVTASDSHRGGTATSALDPSMASITGSNVAIVDFGQHESPVLDQSKERQVQYRDSFVVENSDFDAASSYDFFKRRFCEIQRTSGIIYYDEQTAFVRLDEERDTQAK